MLSTQPGLTASVACFAGALRGTDSAEPPLQLRLDSPVACECLLGGALRMLGHCLRLGPLREGDSLAPELEDRCTTLLLNPSRPLQAAAMRFLATALEAPLRAPDSRFLFQLLRILDFMMQQHAAEPERPPSPTSVLPAPGAAPTATAAAPAEEQEWWQALLALLLALQDAAADIAATAEQLLQRISSLAVAGALGCVAGTGGGHATDVLQLSFCQLFQDTQKTQPRLLEGSTHLLRLFPHASPAVRQLLLQCVALYLQHEQQRSGEAAVVAVFARAAASAGLSAEVSPAGGFPAVWAWLSLAPAARQSLGRPTLAIPSAGCSGCA